MECKIFFRCKKEMGSIILSSLIVSCNSVSIKSSMMSSGAPGREGAGNSIIDKENNDAKRKAEVQSLFNQREKIERRITFLLDASNILIVLGTDYDVKGYNSEASIKAYVVQLRPGNIDQDSFQMSLDEEIERWRSNQNEICSLQARNTELTNQIKALLR
ncbi:MAG: hypothetical protein K2X94_03005 [Amoebophilaceae bacterium]|nr:hypothetical protein [Amoebophilaceae bacterium]